MRTLAEIEDRIRYWNRKWPDPQQQARADAFIEAWEWVLDR
jgi:hypothetical protein